MRLECTCGRSYRFAPHAAGKRARCKSCGRVFTVPGEAAESPDDASTPLEPSPRQRRPAPSEPAAEPPHHEPPHSRSAASAHDPGQPRRRGFWADALLSFVFFVNPANLLPFASLVGMTVIVDVLDVVLLGHLGMIAGLFMGWMVAGIVVSYFMNTLRAAAGGEDSLPRFEDFVDIGESIMRPLFEFFGTALLVLLPAIIVKIVSTLRGDPPEETQRAVVTLGAAGLFFWPMCILAVSLGGIRALTRFDLLLLSIIRLLPAYLAVCALVAAAGALGYVTVVQLQPENFMERFGMGTLERAAIGLTVNLVNIYVMLVAMRLIGLFYRHYHDRLLWVR